MGLSDAEFWQLSLLEFDALYKRYQAAERRQNERIAALICKIHNVHISKGEPLTIASVLGQHEEAKQEPDREQQVAFAKSLVLKHGGKINGK